MRALLGIPHFSTLCSPIGFVGSCRGPTWPSFAGGVEIAIIAIRTPLVSKSEPAHDLSTVLQTRERAA